MGAEDLSPRHIAERLSPAQRLEICLVGANNFEPVRGKLWLQKEMFLLGKALRVESPANLRSGSDGPPKRGRRLGP